MKMQVVEKGKKLEMVQLYNLQSKTANFLDEIDSGLDIDALNRLQKPSIALIKKKVQGSYWLLIIIDY